MSEVENCPDCGYPQDSFACRIRHIHINTGWAKSANDSSGAVRE